MGWDDLSIYGGSMGGTTCLYSHEYCSCQLKMTWKHVWLLVCFCWFESVNLHASYKIWHSKMKRSAGKDRSSY